MKSELIRGGCVRSEGLKVEKMTYAEKTIVTVPGISTGSIANAERTRLLPSIVCRYLATRWIRVTARVVIKGLKDLDQRRVVTEVATPPSGRHLQAKFQP